MTVSNALTELDEQIKEASRSKESFINFIREQQIFEVAPWVERWLEKFWTDTCSKEFFNTYWNGSLDIANVYTSNEELTSLIDDMEKCIIQSM